MTLRLLANENFPRPSILRLRELGYDVQSVAEVCSSAADAEVIAVARREGRIIVTFDRDYGELIFRHRVPSPPGVIYLRFVPETPLEPAMLLDRLFLDSPQTGSRTFVVLTRTTIRTKPLPGD